MCIYYTCWWRGCEQGACWSGLLVAEKLAVGGRLGQIGARVGQRQRGERGGRLDARGQFGHVHLANQCPFQCTQPAISVGPNSDWRNPLAAEHHAADLFCRAPAATRAPRSRSIVPPERNFSCTCGSHPLPSPPLPVRPLQSGDTGDRFRSECTELACALRHWPTGDIWTFYLKIKAHDFLNAHLFKNKFDSVYFLWDFFSITL